MRVFLSLIGIAILVCSSKVGYDLLMAGKLSGGEFVSFLIAYVVIGFVLIFSSEVQEFSIAGNIVKLKKVEKDAEKTIKELKSARTETFRFLLNLAVRHPGGFGNGSAVDSRLKDFWFLFNQIEKFSCKIELLTNISSVLNVLLIGQLNSVADNSDNVKRSEDPPTPDQLTIQALDNKSVRLAAERNVQDGSIDKTKEALLLGLDEHRKLYELKLNVTKKQRERTKNSLGSLNINFQLIR